MSTTTESEKQQIAIRLDTLEDESLRRFHNSVNISFAEMLGYIDKSQNADLAPEIMRLLQTFRDMAERFFAQFESSLLKEIERQRIFQTTAGHVSKRISSLDDIEKKELETATYMLLRAEENASVEYDGLTKRFPSLLQTALDKLKTEWQRLTTIVNANQALKKEEQLLLALEAVVKAAAYSVGIEADRIIIIPADEFSLNFFSYLDNFAVLNVPIHSVRAPWEWSIFWHELAGYRVRQLKNKVALDEIEEKLTEFYTRYEGGNDDKEKELQDVLAVIMRNYEDGKKDFDERRNKFGQRYLNEVFSQDELVLSDLGDFEYQFEKVMKNLTVDDKFQTYEEIKTQGWSVDWFEELFEDTFSVMAIGRPFLDFLEDVLSRNVSSDGRHPPLGVRLKVANEVLRLMNSDDELELPTSIEKSAAQQIIKFMSLLAVSSHQFQENYEQSMWMNTLRYTLPDAVGEQIGVSISSWFDIIRKTKDRVKDVREEADDFINKFSVDDLEFISIFKSRDKKEITPIFDELLDERNYQELLGLSFFSRDFFTGLDISKVEIFVEVSPGLRGWKVIFSSVASTKIINALMTQIGEISFTVQGTSYRTTKINWNRIFPAGDKYNIQ